MSGFVDEDPDEVGYIWRTGKCRRNEPAAGGARKPPHGGYPDPSFNVPDLLRDVRVPDAEAVRRCNAILPPAQQQTISLAARYAFDGLDKYAEKTRVYANYDNLKHRPDADFASGIV